MRWKNDLIKDIRFFDSRDDMDAQKGKNYEGDFSSVMPSKKHVDKRLNGNSSFSYKNQEALIDYFNRIKNNCRAILELGVAHPDNGIQTSTRVFLENKLNETIYIGVDSDDRSNINDNTKNIHTIKTTSQDYETVNHVMKSLHIKEIDFLFIDTPHSINQLLSDWEYSSLLSPHGIVGFHDTAYHPGPHLFLKNLNREIWNVVENVCADTDNDYGIGFVWKKI
jgi:hypothetical protein